MTDRAPGRPTAWRLIAGLAVLAVLAQFWGLYRVTGPPSAPWFPHADKLQHAAGFAAPVLLVLLALGLRATARQPLTRRAIIVVLAVFAVHAGVSEMVQHLFYASRTGDPVDVLADLVGVAIGAAAASYLLRRWNLRQGSASPVPEPSGAVAP